MKKIIINVIWFLIWFGIITNIGNAQNNTDSLYNKTKWSIHTSWSTFAPFDSWSGINLCYTDLGFGIEKRKHEFVLGMIIGPHLEPFVDQYYSYTNGSSVTGKFKCLFFYGSLDHWGIRGFNYMYYYELPQSKITFKKCGLKHRVLIYSAFSNYRSYNTVPQYWPEEHFGEPIYKKYIYKLGIGYALKQIIFNKFSIDFQVIYGLYISTDRLTYKDYSYYTTTHSFLQGKIGFSYILNKRK